MQQLIDHLRRYGIEYFGSDEEWNRAVDHIGAKRLRALRRFRRLLAGSPSEQVWNEFYDFIVNAEIAGLVHSLKAGTIMACGEFVENLLRSRRRVLDVGCNTGYLTSWYASRESDRYVLGIDVSLPCVLAARRSAAELEIRNVEFTNTDLRSCCAIGQFDAIVDTQSLYCVDKEALQVLRNSLMPDGVFISIPPFLSAERCEAYLDILKGTGFVFSCFEFVHFKDLGSEEAYPAFVCSLSGESIAVEFASEFDGLERDMQEKFCASIGARVGRPILYSGKLFRIVSQGNGIFYPELWNGRRWRRDRTDRALSGKLIACASLTELGFVGVEREFDQHLRPDKPLS